MRCDTRYLLEGAQEVIRAEAGHAREVNDGVLLCDACRHMLQHLRDAAMMTMAAGALERPSPVADAGSGESISDLFEFAGLLHHRLGARCQRCERT